MFQEASPCPDDDTRPATLALVGSSLPPVGDVAQVPLQESLAPAPPQESLAPAPPQESLAPALPQESLAPAPAALTPAVGDPSPVEELDYPMTDLSPQEEVVELYGRDGSRITADAPACADNSCGVPPELFKRMFRRVSGTLMQGLCQEFVFLFGRMATDDELTSLFTVSAAVASTL
jgi:hypothetical protein